MAHKAYRRSIEDFSNRAFSTVAIAKGVQPSSPATLPSQGPFGLVPVVTLVVRLGIQFRRSSP